MGQFLTWIVENKEWLFSGAGIAILSLAIGIIYKKQKNAPTQTIRAGKNSINFQAVGDIKIDSKKRKPTEKN